MSDDEDEEEIYHVFYVSVPPEWNLTVKKVYVGLVTPANEKSDADTGLWTVDYDVCTAADKTLIPILDNAPEFKLQEDTISDFVLTHTKLNHDDGERLLDYMFVMISQYENNEWYIDDFFFAYKNDLKTKLIKDLKKDLKEKEVPIFARGSLYVWALLSVAGLIDENTNLIKKGQSLKVDDSWNGWLKVDSNDIKQMETLADSDPAALKLVEKAKANKGTSMRSFMIEYAKLSPMQRVQGYVANKYLAQMLFKLKHALQSGNVKQIANRRRPALTQNSIYDCYQQVKDISGQDRIKIVESAPVYVGSSFIDRTLVLSNRCQKT